MPLYNSLLFQLNQVLSTEEGAVLTPDRKDKISHILKAKLLPEDIFALLTVFKKLNLAWKDIQKEGWDIQVQLAIKSGVRTADAKATCLIVWGLAHLDLSWNDLKAIELAEPLIEAIDRNMSALTIRDRSTILWSLAHLDFPRAEMNPLLFAELDTESITLRDAHQLRIAGIWFDLRFDTSFIQHLNTILATEAPPKSSERHLNFSRHIKQLTWEDFSNEYCILNCVWVDIYFPSHRLAIEIDGPHHNVSLDRFKDKFLKKQGITVIRISVEEIQNYLVDNMLGLKKILQAQDVILKSKPVPKARIYSTTPHLLYKRTTGRFAVLENDEPASTATEVIIPTTHTTPVFSVGLYAANLVDSALAAYKSVEPSHKVTTKKILTSILKTLNLSTTLPEENENEIKRLLRGTLHRSSVIATLFCWGNYEVNLINDITLTDKFSKAISESVRPALMKLV